MDSYVEQDKDSLDYWPFQGIKAKMHAHLLHLPDATIAMQPMFLLASCYNWDVPNMSLPRGQTQVQSQGPCLCSAHTQGPCTRKSTAAISSLPPLKAQNTHQHTGCVSLRQVARVLIIKERCTPTLEHLERDPTAT